MQIAFAGNIFLSGVTHISHCRLRLEVVPSRQEMRAYRRYGRHVRVVTRRWRCQSSQRRYRGSALWCRACTVRWTCGIWYRFRGEEPSGISVGTRDKRRGGEVSPVPSHEEWFVLEVLSWVTKPDKTAELEEFSWLQV